MVARKIPNKKKHYARFKVDLDLRAQDIAKAGAAVEFKVRSSKEMLGTIQIGQGAFRWKGPYGQKFTRLNWNRFFEKLRAD